MFYSKLILSYTTTPRGYSYIFFQVSTSIYWLTTLYPMHKSMLEEVISSYFYFRSNIFTKTLPTYNFSSIYIQHSMLEYLFMLHFRADIQCYLKRQPTFDVSIFYWSHFHNLMLVEIIVANIYVSTSGYLLQ